MKKSPSFRPRSPGRPAVDLALRERLLDTARTEFAAHGFRGVSVTAIARAAGATAAMVHYYFGNKRGLYQAVLEHTLGPFLARLEGELDTADPDAGALPAFVRAYMRFLAGSPEVPALILRDVLSPDGEMREAFVQAFARRGASAVRMLIQRDIERGRMRPDLDPGLATLSLLSLVVFPFVSAPITGRVLDFSPTPDRIEALADHVLKLFYQGVAVPP